LCKIHETIYIYPIIMVEYNPSEISDILPDPTACIFFWEN
jgi:hypothetical protein